jgi:hypothetical protein
MIKIIDNFLEKDLSIYLEQYFLEIPHNFGWTSKGLGEGSPFYQAGLNICDPLIKFLCFKVQQQVNHKVCFIRAYINIHYSNMPGDFHEDDGDTTFVLINKKYYYPNSYSAIRVAGDFTCIHRPWVIDYENDLLDGELKYYHTNNISSTWSI